jgi:hypothetical protein
MNTFAKHCRHHAKQQIPASSCTLSLAETFANRYYDNLKLAQDSSQNCQFKEMLPIYSLQVLFNLVGK